MLSFTDQLGRTIHLASYPERIISVVPSQTELLFDLGLENEVVGITKFCVHPHHWFQSKQRVGGTKTLKMDIIDSLKPDLLIANKEENTKDQIEALAKKYPVWISDVHDLHTALEMMLAVGHLTNRAQNAVPLTQQIRDKFDQLQADRELRTANTNQSPGQTYAAYLVWKDPYLTVGGDTFIHAMLEAAGLTNIFQHLARYPEIKIEDLQNLKCELLLLSTEPFPFNQKHIDGLKPHLPDTKLILVDGEMFSWYGSRLIQSAEYLRRMFMF
jgi:ABC-type Fe3+-hydroxamate transport system substrate-binding protein